MSTPKDDLRFQQSEALAKKEKLNSEAEAHAYLKKHADVDFVVRESGSYFSTGQWRSMSVNHNGRIQNFLVRPSGNKYQIGVPQTSGEVTTSDTFSTFGEMLKHCKAQITGPAASHAERPAPVAPTSAKKPAPTPPPKVARPAPVAPTGAKKPTPIPPPKAARNTFTTALQTAEKAGLVSQDQAIKHLQQHKDVPYVLRPSSSVDGWYTLTAQVEGKINHYLVRPTTNGKEFERGILQGPGEVKVVDTQPTFEKMVHSCRSDIDAFKVALETPTNLKSQNDAVEHLKQHRDIPCVVRPSTSNPGWFTLTTLNSEIPTHTLVRPTDNGFEKAKFNHAGEIEAKGTRYHSFEELLKSVQPQAENVENKRLPFPPLHPPAAAEPKGTDADKRKRKWDNPFK